MHNCEYFPKKLAQIVYEDVTPARSPHRSALLRYLANFYIEYCKDELLVTCFRESGQAQLFYALYFVSGSHDRTLHM